MENRYQPFCLNLPCTDGITSYGYVSAITEQLITAKINYAKLGDYCEIESYDKPIPAQVVSFNDSFIKLAPLDLPAGIHLGSRVKNYGYPLFLNTPKDLLGRIIDVLGNELHFTKPKNANSNISEKNGILNILPIRNNILDKPQINQQLYTGVKCIDAFCPIGYGQRLGLFSGAGVGKSTLLGMIAKNAKVDVTVIALVGERSREVPEFINDVLGKEGLKKSIVVVSTIDETPSRRALAPQVATAIAEDFRARGKNVLLLVDSLTRTARAIREIGLSNGEIPIRQGYPPSVYSALPKLLERAGTTPEGSITAIYTVLTYTDQKQDALGEEIKSLVDGHIVLEPKLAEQGILPAFDITNSISRLQNKLLHIYRYWNCKINLYCSYFYC